MNKVVFITGASRGIGREIALEYAKKGFKLFLTATNIELLKDLSNQINKKGGESDYSRCDVSEKSEVANAVNEAISRFGRIDMAILNAGINGKCYFTEFSDELLHQIYKINVFGVAYCIEYLVPIMKAQGNGIIAGVSSLADFRGVPGSAIYNSSKSALSILLESARIELAQYGITVITVKPGFVISDMTAKNDFYMPFLMETNKAARIIIQGIEKEKKEIKFPFPMALLVSIAKMIPNYFYDSTLQYWDKKYRKNK